MKKKHEYWKDPSYKRCHCCGSKYYRSNRIRLWTQQNPGHRAGWRKEEQLICCSCLKAKMARELLHDLNPQWTTKAV